MEKVIVIDAHYDDPELGAGGSMARLAMEGCSVFKLTLTDNETNLIQKEIKVDFESSVQQGHGSCKILGVKEVDFKPIPCNHLVYDTVSCSQLSQL